MTRITTRLSAVVIAALATLLGAIVLASPANATPPRFSFDGYRLHVQVTTTQVYYAGTYRVLAPACTTIYLPLVKCQPQSLVDTITIPAGTKAGASFTLAQPDSCVGQWDVATKQFPSTIGVGGYSPGYLFGSLYFTGRTCVTPTTPAPTPTTTAPTVTPPPSTPAPSTSVPVPSSSAPTTRPVTTHPVPSTSVSTPAPSTSKPAPVIPPHHTTTTPAKRNVAKATPPREVVIRNVDDTPAPVATGSLAYTGTSTNVKPLAVGGIVLVLIGAAVLYLSRRRGAHQ